MDADRYLRHSLIDWFPQDAVRTARIAVIGAGAVGNEVVKNLALLGVGAIDVFDFDRVEIHNLTRSIFLRESDVGRSKASAVVARAREVDPNVTLRAFEGDFWGTLGVSKLRGYTATVGCVDNFEARIRLNQIGRIAGVDIVNTAVDSRYATVEIFPFASDASAGCYECHLPHSAYQRIAERYSCGWLKRVAYAERKIPTTTVTASVAGALAASAALRLGTDAQAGARRIFCDTLRGTSTVASLPRQPACAGCGAFASRVHIVAARRNWTRVLAETCGTTSFGALVLRLSDPIITQYECVACGDRSHAAAYLNRRASDFDDRIVVCQACGQRAVQVEMSDELAAAELAARFDASAPPVKFALLEFGDEMMCLDFEED